LVGSPSLSVFRIASIVLQAKVMGMQRSNLLSLRFEAIGHNRWSFVPSFKE